MLIDVLLLLPIRGPPRTSEFGSGRLLHISAVTNCKAHDLLGGVLRAVFVFDHRADTDEMDTPLCKDPIGMRVRVQLNPHRLIALQPRVPQLLRLTETTRLQKQGEVPLTFMATEFKVDSPIGGVHHLGRLSIPSQPRDTLDLILWNHPHLIAALRTGEVKVFALWKGLLCLIRNLEDDILQMAPHRWHLRIITHHERQFPVHVQPAEVCMPSGDHHLFSQWCDLFVLLHRLLQGWISV